MVAGAGQADRLAEGLAGSVGLWGRVNGSMRTPADLYQFCYVPCRRGGAGKGG